MKKGDEEEGDVCYLITKGDFMIILECGEEVIIIV